MSVDIKNVITGTALKKVVLKLIPQEFIRNIDLSELGFDNTENLPDEGITLLQKLMNKATLDIRIYGTAEDLARHIRSYRNFSSCHKFSGFDITEEYNYTPRVYNSEHKRILIKKQDLLVQVQYHIFSKFTNQMALTRSVLMIYFKTHEENLNGCFEFVKYDSKFLKSIDTDVGKSEDNDALIRNIGVKQNFNFEEVFDEWKSWIPGWTEEQYEPIRRALLAHFAEFPYKESHVNYVIASIACKRQLSILNETINSHPDKFLPYTPENIKNAPIVVRLFKENDHVFALRSEFFRAINMILPDDKKYKYEDTNGILRVISYDEIQDSFGKLIPKIDFIRMASLISDYGPHYILSPSGDFCILVDEVLRRVFHELILVLKVFQKIKKESWHLVEKYMKWIRKETKYSPKTRHNFVTMSKHESIIQYTREHFKDLEALPAKHVRTVRKTGFNLNDLNRELKDLGLTNVFPKILEFSTLIFNSLLNPKENKVLNTSDMIAAIHGCQIGSIFEMFRSLPMPFRSVGDCVESSKESEDKDENHSNCSASTTSENVSTVAELQFTKRPGSNGSEPSKVRKLKTVEAPVIEDLRNLPASEESEMSESSDPAMEELLQESLKKYEKALSEKEMEFKKMEKTIATQSSVIKDLKSKISIFEEKEEKSKDSNRKLTESKTQLTKRVTNLESQLKIEKQNIQKIEQESNQKDIDWERKISVMKLNYEKDIEDKQRIIDEESELATEHQQEFRPASEMDVPVDLKLKISQLESLLENEKQKTKDLAERVVPHLQQIVRGQVDSNLWKENNQLRDTNIRLSTQVEQQTMTIKAFFEHIGQVPKSYSSTSTQTTPVELTTGYTGVKHHLWSLQKIKDSFRKGHQLKQAKEMVEKLWNQPEIQEMATYELQQYEAQLHHYLQSIEVNIQKIKKTGECTQLDPISDFPTFSDRFLKEYWKLINDKSSESETPKKAFEDDPKDSECLICLIEMTEEEKTMKCEHCQKVLHLKCASEWLKRHRSCPHCRRELLDPNEFPPLS